MSLLSNYQKTMILLAVLMGVSQATTACAVAVVGGGAAAGAIAVQDRGAEGVLDDTRIRTDINNLWYEESRDLYSRINLQVPEGRVLLSGRVVDPQTRVDAVRLAWQVDRDPLPCHLAMPPLLQVILLSSERSKMKLPGLCSALPHFQACGRRGESKALSPRLASTIMFPGKTLPGTDG